PPLRLLREREARDQRHEPHAAGPPLPRRPIGAPFPYDQLLAGEVTDRDDEPPPPSRRHLVRERLGYVRGAGGDEDALERRGRRPSRGAVSQPCLDPGEPRPAKPLFRP